MKPKYGFVFKSIIAVAALLVLVIFLNLYLDGRRMEFTKAEKIDTPTEMFLSMLGELRYTFAAMLWLKADHYHHEVENREGDIFKNPSVLQLTRMVTLLDPHFVQAYSTAAYDLGVHMKKEDEAIKYLDEGIRNNPDAGDLYFDKGFIYFHNKQFDRVIPPLLTAYRLSKDDMDKLNITRLLAHSYVKLEDRENTRKYLGEILEMRPDDYWAVGKMKMLKDGTIFTNPDRELNEGKDS